MPLRSYTGDAELVARLWDNMSGFTQVLGGLGSVPRDRAEAAVMQQIYQAGPVRKADILRVKALLQTWWSVTGQPPRRGMVSGPLGTRYLDLQLANRLLHNEGEVLSRLGALQEDYSAGDYFLSGASEQERHAAARELALAGGAFAWWRLADQDRNALISQLQQLLDMHATRHVHVELQPVATGFLYEARSGGRDFQNRCCSALLRWDSRHCFGLVAKVTWLMNHAGLAPLGQRMLPLAVVATGSWLGQHYRSGIYSFYGLEPQAVPIPAAS